MDRTIFKTIQLLHHLDSKQASNRKFFLNKQLDTFSDYVKPIDPSVTLQQKLEQAKQEFLSTISELLNDHYSSLLGTNVTKTKRPLDVSTFTTAVNKAKQRFGRKLSVTTIDKARELLQVNNYVDSKDTTPNTTPSATRAIKGTRDPLSNLWMFPSETTFHDHIFTSGEQIFQFSKFMFCNEPKLAYQILNLNDPFEIISKAKDLTKLITSEFGKNQLRRWYDCNRFNVLYKIFNHKFTHFKSFQQALKHPGYYFHPVPDQCLGTGLKDRKQPLGPGQDKYSKLLMKFRMEKLAIPVPATPEVATHQPLALLILLLIFPELIRCQFRYEWF